MALKSVPGVVKLRRPGFKQMLGGLILPILSLELLALGAALAQSPSGAIFGRVNDPSGAAISGARVVVTNQQTGATRALITGAEGEYGAPALPAGIYEVATEASGFQRLVREAIIQAGTTTTVNFNLRLGAIHQTMTVEGATPQLHYDAHEVSGVVTRLQIEALPLNGRGFLELAKLEPGAQQPTRASNNRTFVPLLGAPVGQSGRGTRVTVDGGSIMQIGNGGSAMGFSQEVVQEFQVSTVNFDLSTGATAGGAVNVVTRSGTNDLHGSAFLFFRDHQLSAFPGLRRSLLDPDPFFQRRQFGFEVGGPLRKERAFFFTSFERNEQRSVISTQLLTPEFIPLSRITPSPTFANQLTTREDLRLNERHLAFLRYSYEGINAYDLTTLTRAGAQAYPSAWTRQPGHADQGVLGLTSQLDANLVNEFRFSYFFVSSAEEAPTEADCPGCLGIGAPSITVNPDLFIGTSLTTRVLGRRYHFHNVLAWQKGRHRLRFGGDGEITRGGRTDRGDDPVNMILFSPQNVRDYNALPSTPPSLQIPLPTSFLRLEDILLLPVRSFTVGIGDPYVPQKNFGRARVAPLVHLFYHDTWQLHSRFTLNYGLGWTYDAPLNYDLAKPPYLEPILGERGMSATRQNWKNFSPSAGFAWSPRQDGKTIVRGGGGIYYDFQVPFGVADPERVSLGPFGVGRGTYLGSGIPNPLTDVPGVPAGALLDFRNPTLFTGARLLEALPAIQAYLAQLRGDPNNRDFAITNIELNKQGSVVASHLPGVSATHASLGVQHEVARDFVVSADYVYRQFAHVPRFPGVDLNRFLSARGPVLPICNAAQRSDPRALCSLGPIIVFRGIGRARYQGLLLRAEKRHSRGWQLLGSYAYASNQGHNFLNGFNNDDWLENYGPLDVDFRHLLTVSGLVELPRKFQLAFVATYNSAPPFSAFLGGLDLNGDGTAGDLLPGTQVNQFGRDLGEADLHRLVDEFNRNYAGERDARGRLIPTITLPAHFAFNDGFFTQDLRLSRVFARGERWRLTLTADVFNVFNIANVSRPSGDLLGAGFGQPANRVTQVFGSGGPRAFQFAAKVSF